MPTDAEIRLALETLQQALGAEKPSSPVRDLWPKFGERSRAKLASWRDDLGRWSHNVEPYFGAIPAETITEQMVEDYRAHRAGQLTRRRKPPTPATVNREIMLLKRILNYSAARRLIRFNPLADTANAPENNIRHTKISGEEQLARLLGHCSPLLAALVLTLYDTGMRRMEAIGLRWDEIDFETSRAVLRHTKNGQPRRPKLTPRVISAIAALPKCSEWIFANPETRKPYHPRYLYELFLRAVRASGLEGIDGEQICFHTFRHSFAYVARRRRRLSEKQIMAMGGWKTRAAFDRYGIVDEEETEEAWENFAKGLNAELAQIAETKRVGPKRSTVDPLPHEKDLDQFVA